MKKFGTIAILFFLLASCQNTYINIPVIQSSPTPIIVPTMKTIQLANYSATLEGVGEHGGMVCIKYPGYEIDLADTSLFADFFQDDELIEKNVHLQEIEGKKCFEILDAKYKNKAALKMRLSIIGDLSKYENNVQDMTLDEYVQFPFIQPLFRKNEVQGKFVDHNHISDGFYAHDYWFGNGKEGTPVHMPFSFQLLEMHMMTDKGFEIINSDIKYNWNMWIYHPYTGYACVLQHQQPGDLFTVNSSLDQLHYSGEGWPPTGSIFNYDRDNIISTFGPKDIPSSLSHLHIACQIPMPKAKNFEKHVGFDFSSFPLCKTENPCEGNPNIEMKDLYLRGIIE